MENTYISPAEARAEISAQASRARSVISGLFDEGTFLETGTFLKNGNGTFEGVITGCGAVNGRPVFAFIQDYENGSGAFTSAHARKIGLIYDAALKAMAPVVGVYSSAGARLGEGIDAVSGFGEVIAKQAQAKEYIPQISIIAGPCGGGNAVSASMADFTVCDRSSGNLYLLPQVEGAEKNSRADITADNMEEAVGKVKELLSFIPSSSAESSVCGEPDGDINIPSSNVEALASSECDVKELISELADGGKSFMLSDGVGEMECGFAMINGRAVGIVADQPTENGGALTSRAAKKAASFIDFLGRFGIPLLTLVNTVGFGGKECRCYLPACADLARAYTSCASAKITVVVGRAYGSAMALLGSKKLGADMVFALDSSVISVMPPRSAVEFVWEDRIKSAEDPDAAREELASEWINTAASPMSAARSGDIDDIIEYSELRQRIAAALEMFA